MILFTLCVKTVCQISQPIYQTTYLSLTIIQSNIVWRNL